MYVYVISGGADVQKIGITNDTVARLKALQTANWEPLTLALAILHPQAQAVEKMAHGIAAAWRLKGEGFRMDSDTAVAVVQAAIRRVRNEPDHEWGAAGGWVLAAGDHVVCRKPLDEGFPAPHPVVGGAYTVSEVYEDGTVAVAEIENDLVAFCPSMFRPAV